MIQNLDKSRVAERFLKSAHSYDGAAVIQNRIAQEIVELLKKYGLQQYKNAFEIGCCTGNLTKRLLEQCEIEHLIINDLVPEFETCVVDKIKEVSGAKISPCFGDIESLNFPTKLDLIISCSTLQWLEDMLSFLSKIDQGLSKDGIFALSVFTEDTMKEVRKLTGVGLNYISPIDILAVLKPKVDVVYWSETKTELTFPTVKEVLVHLRETGVGGVDSFRWSKSSLQSFEKEYTRRFKNQHGYPVSYNYLNLIAKAK